MEITGDLFLLPLRDPKGVQKLLLSGLVGMISILFPIASVVPLGLGVRQMRAVVMGEPLTNPDYTDPGNLLLDGLQMMVVLLAYNLPYIAMYMAALFAYFAMWLGMIFLVEGQSALVGVIILVIVLVSGGLVLSGLLLVPLAGFLGHIAMTRVVALGSLAKAFELKEVWALFAHGYDYYLRAAAISGAMILTVSMLTIVIAILPCVGFIGTALFVAVYTAYIRPIGATLYGMAYNQTIYRMWGALPHQVKVTSSKADPVPATG